MISTQTILKRLCRSSVQLRRYSSSNGTDSKDTSNSSTQTRIDSPEPAKQNRNQSDALDAEIPPPPTNCCMSGCANCVWIQYADELATKLRGGTSLARDIIMKEVEDPNMRSFLEMELRMLNKKTET